MLNGFPWPNGQLAQGEKHFLEIDTSLVSQNVAFGALEVGVGPNKSRRRIA